MTAYLPPEAQRCDGAPGIPVPCVDCLRRVCPGGDAPRINPPRFIEGQCYQRITAPPEPEGWEMTTELPKNGCYAVMYRSSLGVSVDGEAFTNGHPWSFWGRCQSPMKVAHAGPFFDERSAREWAQRKELERCPLPAPPKFPVQKMEP